MEPVALSDMVSSFSVKKGSRLFPGWGSSGIALGSGSWKFGPRPLSHLLKDSASSVSLLLGEWEEWMNSKACGF